MISRPTSVSGWLVDCGDGRRVLVWYSDPLCWGVVGVSMFARRVGWEGELSNLLETFLWTSFWLIAYQCSLYETSILDVWFQITVPLSADELPPLPEPEGTVLLRNLRQVSLVISCDEQGTLPSSEFLRLTEASEFFLGFLCNCFSCFPTARITFTGILYIYSAFVWFILYTHCEVLYMIKIIWV